MIKSIPGSTNECFNPSIHLNGDTIEVLDVRNDSSASWPHVHMELATLFVHTELYLLLDWYRTSPEQTISSHSTSVFTNSKLCWDERNVKNSFETKGHPTNPRKKNRLKTKKQLGKTYFVTVLFDTCSWVRLALD